MLYKTIDKRSQKIQRSRQGRIDRKREVGLGILQNPVAPIGEMRYDNTTLILLILGLGALVITMVGLILIMVTV